MTSSLESIVIKPLADWYFEPERAQRKLKERLGVASMKGYEIAHEPALQTAANALIEYAAKNSGLSDDAADYSDRSRAVSKRPI